MALRTNSIVRHFDSLRTVLTKSWAGVFVDAAGSGSYTDYTSAANNETASDVPLSGTSGGYLYLGLANRFGAVQAVMGTLRSNVALNWEYWNGSTWTTLTVASLTTNGSKFADAGGNVVYWNVPVGWATTTVNSVSAYWVRVTNGATAGTPGTATYFNAGPSYIVSQTIDIPETSSRTIRSATIRFSCHPNSVVSLLFHRASATLAGGVKTAITNYAMDVNALGSNVRHVTNALEISATSFFAANFSGASATLDLDITLLHEFGGAVTTVASSLGNCCATLFLTYEYDDASLTTATKTVFIPIESTTNTILTGTLASIGTSQIPALDTFCPEASKSFKEIAIVLFANSATSQAGASPNLALALDAEAETTMCPLTMESGYGAGVFEEYHWVRNDMDTSVAHDLKVRASDGAGTTQTRYPFIAGYLAVTYTYNASTSTRILNSLVLPLEAEGTETGYSTSRPSSMIADVQVVEPGTLNLRQSAIMTTFCEEGPWSVELGLSIGAQSFRVYDLDDLTADMAAGLAVVQRLDSSGAAGAGLTLAKGKNRVSVRYYTDSGGVSHCNVGGVVFLNYESDKSASGVGAHNHTTWWSLLVPSGASPSASWSNGGGLAPNIPETSYWLTGVGVAVVGAAGAQWNRFFFIAAFRESGEREGAGKQEAYAAGGWGPQHAERVFTLHSATKLFKQYPAQANGDLMDVETGRHWWIGFDAFGKASMLWAQLFVTYHAVRYSFTGTVTNGSGTAQSGATVTLHRNDTGETLDSTTTDGSGNYTLRWYDDTVAVHSETRISGVLVGRSDNGFCS